MAPLRPLSSHDMKSISIIVIIALGLSLTGCGPSPGELAAEASRAMADGNPQQAVNLLQQAVEQRPDVAEFHVGLGMAYEQTGNQPAAESAYEQALILLKQQQAEPGHDEQDMLNTMFVLHLLGRDEEVRQRLQAARQQFPESRALSEFRQMLDETDDQASTSTPD